MARQVGGAKHKAPGNPHKSAASKLSAVTEVPEPKDINWKVDLKLTTYNFQGNAQYDWDISQNVTDVRVLPDTTQASTVEIDLDDSDYELLQHPLFAHWAFDIQNVSLSSSKKFKTSRLTNSTNNEYLGDDSDLEWVLGQRPIDFTIGDVVFRLCGLSTQDTILTLTFEDRVASFLRDKEGFKTVRRGSHTRAQFVAMLCREANVPYWIPELDISQPVETSTSSLSASQNRQVTGKGLSTGQGLTVKGQAMTSSQKDAANVILDVAKQLNAPTVAAVAMVYSAIWESGLTLNDPPNSQGYGGVLAGANAVHPYRDSVGMAKAYLQGDGHRSFQGPGAGGAIAGAKSISNPVELAVKVEVPSIWPDNAYAKETGYPGDDAATKEAEKIVQNYGSFSGSVNTTNPTTTTSVYSFTRGPNEDSYDCIQRLASEVAWYTFVRQNRLWYVSGNYLFQQDPQMTLERGKRGIDTIDPNLDMGARDSLAQCTVLGRTDLWAALPGMVVQVNKRGPATGKWFVASLESHPLDLSQQVTITLQKPVPKRSEPAPTQVTQSANPNAVGQAIASAASGTSNPAPGATWSRLDMGFDGNYGPLGAHAPYSGKVHWDRRGWPGQGDYIWIVNDDQTGPDYTRAIYFAEGASHSIQDGQHVQAGQQVGRPVASGGNGTPGNFEIGPANTTNGEALAKTYGLGSPGARKMVLAFEQWMHSLGTGLSNDRSAAGRT